MTVETHTESILIEKIRKSDSNAFKTIYYQYFKDLHRFAYSRTKCLEAAKDYTQDTFKKVWQNRERIVIKSSLKSYLFRIIHSAHDILYCSTLWAKLRDCKNTLLCAKSGYRKPSLENAQVFHGKRVLTLTIPPCRINAEEPDDRPAIALTFRNGVVRNQRHGKPQCDQRVCCPIEQPRRHAVLLS